jgi:Phage virion morphogenesis family
MPSSHTFPSPQRFESKLVKMFDQHRVRVRKTLAPTIAKDLVRELRSRIRQQAFVGWAPLNPEYKDRKQKEGFDTRTLIKTGEYVNAIDWHITPAGNVTIGFNKRTHTGSGLPMLKLAKILEYGSAKQNIPARPHWGPTIEYIRKKYGI